MLSTLLLFSFLFQSKKPVTLEFYCDYGKTCNFGPRRFGYNEDGTPYLNTTSTKDFKSVKEALAFLDKHQGYGGLAVIEDTPGGEWLWKRTCLLFTIDKSGKKHYELAVPCSTGKENTCGIWS